MTLWLNLSLFLCQIFPLYGIKFTYGISHCIGDMVGDAVILSQLNNNH